MTSVDSVAYTWDDRGNLIEDGTFTYAYNSTGRLVRAESVTNTVVYTYTATGLRVAQSVGGNASTYAWDWASGLPEMLSEGGNLYLVGHETLGWWDGNQWAYILPDALGSVRRVTDETGAVTDAREWTPYGEEIGGTQEGLGYAGEWQDAALGLTYLRARWYDGQTGRFTRRDPWEGDHKRPLTLNRWNYVESNPVNHADPIGYGVCLSLVGTQQWMPFLTVGQAIAMCQELFDKNNWEQLGVDCGKRCAQRWSSPQTVTDLWLDYLCECGPEHVFFDGKHCLTKELARSVLLDPIREEFYQEGYAKGDLDFDVSQFFFAWLDAAYSTGSRLEPIPITHFLGSFEYSVIPADASRVGF